jgi:hypothetical protein
MWLWLGLAVCLWLLQTRRKHSQMKEWKKRALEYQPKNIRKGKYLVLVNPASGNGTGTGLDKQN